LSDGQDYKIGSFRVRVDEDLWWGNSDEAKSFRNLEEEGFRFLWCGDFVNLTIEDDGLEVHLIPIISWIGGFFQLYMVV